MHQKIQLDPIPKICVLWHILHIDISDKLNGKSTRKEYVHIIINALTKLLKYTLTLNSMSAIVQPLNLLYIYSEPCAV